jgi:hypothetical protein
MKFNDPLARNGPQLLEAAISCPFFPEDGQIRDKTSG